MENKKSTNLATLRAFWGASLRHKHLLILSFFFPLGAICIGSIAPLFVGKIIAALPNPHANPMHYVPYFVITAVCGVIFNRIGFNAQMSHQAKTMADLQERALQALLRRSVGFHNNNIGGKLVSDAIDYPNAFSQLSVAAMNTIIPLTLTLTVGTVLVCTESWVLGTIVASMTIVLVGWGFLDSRRNGVFRRQRLKAQKAVTAHAADVILNVQTVKTFAHEKEELSRHNKLANALLNRRLHDWHLAGRLGNYRIMALFAMQLVFILLVVRVVHQNPALLGIGIFAFSFTITLTNRLFDINVVMRQIEDGFLNASPMTEILEQETEVRDRPDAKKLHITKGALELHDVDFRYQDSSNDQAVFSHLNLAVRPGEKIGLVGPSGGGKSTLTRLLLRFEDINQGSIIIDGQDIAAVTQESLRKAISYVPQEPLLFHRTILENIAYGNPRATLEQVKRAAKQAHADTFINALPNGYDTVVGERGVKLSGGQRQRIAIARAILKDAPLLILDEATSALDSESEVLIQQALWQLMERRTAIVVAHRLSTIQKMDRIIVLADGMITEQGTHSELLRMDGLYAKLWAHQSGGFIEE